MRCATMNVYQIIILVTLLGKYLLDVISHVLNLKSLSPGLPDEFVGFYDEERYKKSQEYTKTRTRFYIIHATFGLIVLLFFWFLGGFNALDHIVRGWGFRPVLAGLCYIGMLVLLLSLLALPFDLYSTFVIEERFGFNRTTLATFIADRLRAVALAILLGGIALAVILWLFDFAGSIRVYPG